MGGIREWSPGECDSGIRRIGRKESTGIADQTGSGQNTSGNRSLSDIVEFPEVASVEGLCAKAILAADGRRGGVGLRDQDSSTTGKRTVQIYNQRASWSAGRVIGVIEVKGWVDHVDTQGADASELSRADGQATVPVTGNGVGARYRSAASDRTLFVVVGDTLEVAAGRNGKHPCGAI